MMGGGGRDNFARDNSGIVGGMTDRTAEALAATASSAVAPPTPQQVTAWQTQWPNITLKDFDSSVKYFSTVAKKDLSSQKKTVGTPCTAGLLVWGWVGLGLTSWTLIMR